MYSATKLSDLEQWLHLNSFWNTDILEIKKSEKFNGLGVFQRKCDVEDDDRLLLRIPKSNILSVKNSCIANLLEDYVEEQIQRELVNNGEENEDDEEDTDDAKEEEDRVDLSIELHSLLLCFIYEHSMGPKSPWFEYINSIDLESGDLPLCLWDEEDKKLLQNTECDLLHMLDISELVELFAECIRFARSNSSYISIPSVLNWEGDDFQHELVKSRSQLEKFGTFLQAVLSRSFPIDGFHGLSLVPGADMFNHSDLADVKFVRDEDVCDQCGERDCEHDQEDVQDEEEDFEEIDEDDEVDGFDEEEIEEILNNDDDIESEEGENNIESESIEVDNLAKKNEDVEEEAMASDEELESSEDEFESETELVSSEDETATETEEVDEDEEGEDVVEEITAEYIKIMETELEEEENEDEESNSEGTDDNESLLELSEDEDEAGSESADADELGKQLATDQCCDIFLLNSKNGEELYNFYGEFSNPILLQRYGFIEEENISDSCMLTVQMFAYLKKITGRKGTQLNIKLQWYDEMGFELVNDLLTIGLQSSGHDHDHDHEHEHNHDHDHEGEDCEESQCCDSDDEDTEQEEEPISWELSPKVTLDGSPTPQTYALLRLILMPFNLFQAKFLHCQSESKLCRRILKLLLPNSMPILHPRVKREHEEVFKVFNLWCKNRLNRYSDGLSTGDYNHLLQDSSLSSQRRTIFRLLKSEKEILARGCVFSAKDHDAQYSEE
ncbi:hypothetical protein CLIB1423_21S00232 [[Candida] railenensis]|uniref:Ribosomal lysine N-methyltransferase 3 n=1 Tax=[Candida] railenensis TaxID=45579 RepID=A0A9P0W0H0_9ASCO|nr:hypothetical protein CLIB1423_21S00232 [[Candida] railenensis]